MQILTIQFVSRSQKQTCQVLKNIMREAGPRISRLAPNAQMWPSVVRCEFFVGVWPTSSSRKLYILILKSAICGTLKHWNNKSLLAWGKLKEIFQKYDTVHFSKPSIDILHKSRRTCTIIFFGSQPCTKPKSRQCCIKKSWKHTSWPKIQVRKAVS